ncbi:uncharacterized protein LY79DRAFT_268892 [Colletotrichum navitas]|uniref:Ankyrin repeat protein n=1 Tax=Colletotrichum navitas TaxID=681940 RepID=A0AAD8V1L4_9PEZI|nr:uncharacterized protein LY79DRAFT_268892 [Colletotrichum navitas]KAK1585471.1 hypothetical protein LY79DRAFT_268892 [Colletotrichum navitas]
MDPLSITASTITVIQSLIAAYDTIKHIKDLPKAFAEVGRNLPLVKETLDLAQQALDADRPDEDVQGAIQPALAECLKRARTIKDIFSEIEPGRQNEKGGAREWSVFVRFYRKKVVPFGKAHKVEALMRDILSKLKVLAIHHVFKAHAESLGQMEKLEGAIKALAEVEPSLPDSEFDGGSGTNVTQNISDSGRGLVSTGERSENTMGDTTKYQSGGGPMNFVYYGHDTTRAECDPKSNPVEWLRHVSKPLDFEKTHAESFRIAQRTPKAGRWFLKSTEFKEQWCDGSLRKLWCHGIPGTGKTVLSSIVINHLRARFSSNPEIACVFIYFDHRQHQDHCLTKLLCSMILQLSRGAKNLSAKVQEAHSAWRSTQQTPSERDYLKMLKSQAKGFKTIYFVVDALDECLDDDLETNTLNGFLGVCRELPDSFKLLFTSRPVSKFRTLIDPGCELPITAHNDDISAYLHSFIESRPQLNGIVEKGCKADPSFRAKALATITDKSHGMFLLAHLHIKSLASTHSLAGFKSGLAQLSTSPDAVYATALGRIKNQDRPRRELALKALNWLVNSERELSVDELTHALAIHNGAEESRSPAWQLPRASDIAGIEDALISACVGIVVVLADRLTEPRTDDICREYPLYGYAANFWGVHLDKATGPKGGDLYKLAWRFVSDRPRLDAAVRAMTDPRVAHEANVSGVHVAAFFGLEKLVRKAIANGRDINLNAQTRRGETPLHWAATHGRRTFAEFLVREGAELNVPNADRRTALHKAIMGGGDGALVDAILAASGLNLELEDAEGYTCLRWAAAVGDALPPRDHRMAADPGTGGRQQDGQPGRPAAPRGGEGLLRPGRRRWRWQGLEESPVAAAGERSRRERPGQGGPRPDAAAPRRLGRARSGRLAAPRERSGPEAAGFPEPHATALRRGERRRGSLPDAAPERRRLPRPRRGPARTNTAPRRRDGREQQQRRHRSAAGARRGPTTRRFKATHGSPLRHPRRACRGLPGPSPERWGSQGGTLARSGRREAVAATPGGVLG